MNNHVIQYVEYNKKIGDRKGLYRMIASEFDVKKALYPGSHIDIGPSLFIREVTYIDNFKGAIKFFKKNQEIMDYINDEKEYKEESNLVFLGENYEDEQEIEKVDLIISQYAGFVCKATKRYLKKNGILLCNDSHGDATMTYFDKDFKLIGVVSGKNKIERNSLDKYFKLSKGRNIDLNEVVSAMKGPKYKYQAQNYLFEKIR